MPTELTPRDVAILRHVGLYRLTLQVVVAHHFMPVNSEQPTDQQRNDQLSQAGVVLTRLARDGFLNHHHKQNPDFPPFDGNVSYFTLTQDGASAAGAPIDRAEDLKKGVLLKETALALHLPTLWYCLMYNERRHRLEPKELASLFGKQKFFDNVAHCVVHGKGGLRVDRIYAISANMPEIVRRVRKIVDEVRNFADIRPWVDDHDYGIAILAPAPSYCTDIKQEIKRAKLTDEVRVMVSLGPNSATIRSALKNHRGWEN